MYIVSQNKQKIINMDNIVEVYAKNGEICAAEAGADCSYKIGNTEDEESAIMKIANALVECNEEVYCIE